MNQGTAGVASDEVKLLVLTQQFPFGRGEAFLVPEVRELGTRVQTLYVVPRSPTTVIHDDAKPFETVAVRQPLLSLEVVSTALRLFLAHPIAVWRAASVVLHSRSLGVFLRNVCVLPKAFWITKLMRDRGVTHLHCHWAATVGTMGLVAHRYTGIPWSLTAHRWDIVENNLLREKTDSATFVRFISDSGVALADKHLAPNAHVIVTHLGVDEQPRAAQRPNNAEFTLLCAANLIGLKGHRYLFEAVARLMADGVAVRLLVAGTGPLAAELAQLADQLRVKKVIDFLGVVPHDKLLAMYGRGDVDAVVLPSLDLGDGRHEGIPVSLMEAMSFGIPVVSTRTGGIPELVTTDTGRLVPPADAAALAAAIRELHADPTARAEMGTRAQARVQAEFSAKRSAAELLARIKSEKGGKL